MDGKYANDDFLNYDLGIKKTDKVALPAAVYIREG